MIWRLLPLLAIMATGCAGDPRVPPPGTGVYNAPNPYYQPSGQGAYNAPSYGAGAATTTGAGGQLVAGAPDFSRTGINLVANGTSQDGLNWQPVTRQPAIGSSAPSATGGTINPRSTLTAARTPTASAATNTAVTNIAQLPPAGTAGAPLSLPAPPATYSTAIPPAYAPVSIGSRQPIDPWRGR